MIEKATSIQFKDQVKGTFNRPIISICRTSNGLRTYFLKYPRNNNEIDGIFSEIVCSKLAENLHLNTPEIAIVEIGSHSIDPDRIIHHDKLQTGQVIFGSKKLEKSDELSQLDFVLDKHDYNRLEYPPHILRIGLFDLWIGNRDRKGDNFNLFLNRSKKQKIFVFDHFEAFAKLTENNQNEVSLDVDIWQGLLGTRYGYEMLGWVHRDNLEQEVNEFLSFARSLDANDFLDSLLEELPKAWNIKSKTIKYVNRFLSSKQRLQMIETEVKSYLEYLPKK